ncbi:MAG TPA: hypothetical protein PL182_11595, partial [Pseudobdellovibrionaceae bacterium]|nr:hypothetical protein [Pseudobdellovibrionaceae bacterium]
MLRQWVLCLLLLSGSAATAAPIDFLLGVVGGKTSQFGDYPRVGGSANQAEITKLFERSQTPRSRVKYHGEKTGKAVLAEMTKEAGNLWKALNNDYAFAKDFSEMVTSRGWYVLSQKVDSVACSGGAVHYVWKDLKIRL